MFCATAAFHNHTPFIGDQKAITRSFFENGDACEPDLLLVYERTCHRGVRSPLCVPKERAVSKLENTLQDAVKKQMQADVPRGAFLSGGVDSSLIVALMQEQSSCPINTFSIGFEDQKFNEAPFAKKVARHLGTDHLELYVSASEARSVIPNLPRIYDEPFSDSSQIPTFLVSQMAKEHVTVALSGDGMNYWRLQ